MLITVVNHFQVVGGNCEKVSGGKLNGVECLIKDHNYMWVIEFDGNHNYLRVIGFDERITDLEDRLFLTKSLNEFIYLCES